LGQPLQTMERETKTASSRYVLIVTSKLNK